MKGEKMEINWLVLALTAFVESWLFLYREIEKSNELEWDRPC